MFFDIVHPDTFFTKSEKYDIFPRQMCVLSAFFVMLFRCD